MITVFSNITCKDLYESYEDMYEEYQELMQAYPEI